MFESLLWEDEVDAIEPEHLLLLTLVGYGRF
ncbi:MAG: hypothetical protein HLUCCO16_09520 [Phormidium sp. OSCR]|nr:MAG: hypothetical protein HLUCCO16_09520 [Phormidium sp. OSCR]